MSGKLDQSLDDISKTRRASNRRKGPAPGKRAATGKARTAAPTGGVSKKSSNKASGPSRAAAAAAGAAVVPASGHSKIIVSGLPADVTEDQIKEYFAKAVGPVRRAILTYGPNGLSKGIATIIFTKPESASAAASSLNGVKVDNRSIRVEVVLGASQVAAPPAPKGLGDRIAKPKTAAGKAKAGDKAKPKTAGGAGTGSAGGKGKAGGRRGRAARPKPKSAAELDQEMTDYFVPAANGAPATAAPNGIAAAGGDAAMEEEVL